MKQTPASTRPKGPPRRYPRWMAISVEFGPGIRLVAPRRSRNRSRVSHPRRRTTSSSSSAMCAAGPPNAVAPRRRKSSAISRSAPHGGAGAGATTAPFYLNGAPQQRSGKAAGRSEQIDARLARGVLRHRGGVCGVAGAALRVHHLQVVGGAGVVREGGDVQGLGGEAARLARLLQRQIGALHRLEACPHVRARLAEGGVEQLARLVALGAPLLQRAVAEPAVVERQ